jgi:hypothetical protein
MVHTALSPVLRKRLWPPTHGDWVAIWVCLIPVVLSALTIWRNWEWVYHDFFLVQLPHNLTYNPLSKIIGFRWWLVLLGGLCLAARRFRSPAAVWLLYGLVGVAGVR